LVDKKKTGSTQNELVQCDLEFPAFQKELADLENADLDAFLNKIETINRMTWAQVYATSSKGTQKRGLNWEVLPNQRTSTGGVVASIRVTGKFHTVPCALLSRLNLYVCLARVDRTYRAPLPPSGST